MVGVVGYGQEWHTDLNAARQKAAASDKKILLVFSGPGWCQPCMELDKKLWLSDEFLAEAEDRWILLRADFPQKKGDPEPVNINDPKIILAEKFNRDGFFPFFVVLDQNGRLLGKSGYEKLETPQEYISLFKKLGRQL
ncbi:thioredoxin family protein [Flavobacterium sp. Sd200]|nr:thioredoxin family protein [Flavobacterium sp. Sd200]MXN90595.1 thioredoxin family protein [Flavobacterium sp. Sd200]